MTLRAGRRVSPHQGGGRASTSLSLVRCAAQGQGLFAGINGGVDQVANVASLSWHFTAPESTRIASFRIWRAAGVEPESAPNAGVLPAYTLNRDRNDFDGAYVDETSPVGAGTAADMAWFRMYRAAIVLADDTDPESGYPFALGTSNRVRVRVR